MIFWQHFLSNIEIFREPDGTGRLRINDITDFSVNGVKDKQVLMFDADKNKFINFDLEIEDTNGEENLINAIEVNGLPVSVVNKIARLQDIAKQSQFNDYTTTVELNSQFLKINDANDTYLKNTTAQNNYAKKSDLNNKVTVELGKGLSTNDFTNEMKAKLEAISGAVKICGRVDTVSDLPTTAEDKDGYFVGLETATTKDLYVYSSELSRWIKVGNTDVDLSGYLKISDAEDIYLKITDASSTYATKSEVSNKVDKDGTKQLSSNDFTDGLLNKLNGLTNYVLPNTSSTELGGMIVGNGLSVDGNGVVSVSGDAINFIDSISLNGTELIPDVNKCVNFKDIVTKSDLLEYAKKKDVDKKVDKQTGLGLSAYSFSKAYKDKIDSLTNCMNFKGSLSSTAQLPTEADQGDCYFVGTGDIRTIYYYFYELSVFKNIGTTNINMDGYLTEDDAELTYLKINDAESTYLSIVDATDEYVQKDGNKVLSTNDFTNELLEKLQSVQMGANKYTLPIASSSQLGGIRITNASGMNIDSNGVLRLNANQTNIIERVKVNGIPLVPDSTKTVSFNTLTTDDLVDYIKSNDAFRIFAQKTDVQDTYMTIDDANEQFVKKPSVMQFTLSPNSFVDIHDTYEEYTYSCSITIDGLNGRDVDITDGKNTTINEQTNLMNACLGYYTCVGDVLNLFFRGYKPTMNVKIGVQIL